ncbi:hypothetical protein DBADOPDK_05766 [Pseudomonas sp. MM223]|nr:hypothetical protein DBADOPDK_05766 [Pseudomonas sp. MM223]
METQWQIWLVFGIALTLLELVLPTFFILWFGIGAVLVPLISLAAPSPQLDMQVLAVGTAVIRHYRTVVQSVPAQTARRAMDRR